MHKDEVKPLFIYERFEALRASRGITKRFIAQSLGRSPTLCQDWKLRKSQPSDEQLAVVARILGTTPEYLRGETDEVSPAGWTCSAPSSASTSHPSELFPPLPARHSVPSVPRRHLTFLCAHGIMSVLLR